MPRGRYGRLAGRALQWCGLVLMIFSGPIALGFGTAYGMVPTVVVTPSPVPMPSLSPTPAPSPTPTPSPLPKPTPPATRTARGGPVSFELNGNLSLGRTTTSSTFGSGGFFNTPTPSPGVTPSPGPFPFQNATTTTQSTNQVGAGLSAQLTRRTATTLTSLQIPIGLTIDGKSTFALSSLLYSTPKYSLGYGQQPLNALGQLQLGSTLRGFSLIRPERYGQITYYEGQAYGANSELVDLEGFLSQQVRGTWFLEDGLIYTPGGPVTGKSKTFLVGVATAHGDIGIQDEAAYQIRSGGDTSPHGFADQFRLDDYGKKGSGCTTTVRSVPNGFVSFGAGEVFGDRYLDIGCHGSKIPFATDVSWETTGNSDTGVDKQRLMSLSYVPAFRFGGVSLSVQHQDANSSGSVLTSNAITTSLSTTLFGTNLSASGNALNSDNSGTQQQTRSLLASISREVGHFNIAVNGQVQVQSQFGLPTDSASDSSSSTPEPVATPFVGIQRGFSFSISRSWRKTAIQFGETYTRTFSEQSDAIQRTPLINLTRQISPAISIATSLGFQDLTDPRNPTANGRTRIFSISLNAPFSYGNGIVTGRIDPRLPATIVGRVLLTTPTSGSGAALNIGTLGGSGGIGNVIVTLDGKTVERTDLTGGFQFSFVTPGVHTVTINTGTIPPGFTASSPVQTVELKGGQQTQLAFNVSTLGGILGHVYGEMIDGFAPPLAHVKLVVDGNSTYTAETDVTGAFGFGGLSPGQHVVTVIENSVPATATFATEDLKRTVSVSNGRYTDLDFHAQALGSIEGEIVFANDMSGSVDYKPGEGVPNAYVVAEPGEHAAIDDFDGSFVLDNLPAGDYTVSVDPETIPDPSLGAAPDSVSVHLEPGERYKGLRFLVGHTEKKVVFSLLSGNAPPVLPSAVRLGESKLPPRGTTAVSINAPASAKGVSVTFLGKVMALAYDKATAAWAGEIEVPPGTVAGKYKVEGNAGVPAIPASATLTVDPSLPLVIVSYEPKRPPLQTQVLVRARFLVDVHAGERITWQDGDVTILGKPLSGRVFTFRKRITALPLHGLLLTPAGNLPIELL